jgi:hypothetical protein
MLQGLISDNTLSPMDRTPEQKTPLASCLLPVIAGQASAFVGYIPSLHYRMTRTVRSVRIRRSPKGETDTTGGFLRLCLFFLLSPKTPGNQDSAA